MAKLRLTYRLGMSTVTSPVELWVLAMLAPKAGCAWLRSRRKGGEFDRLCARLPGL
jgi:hypothetical protein